MKFTREVPTEDGWYWVAVVYGAYTTPPCLMEHIGGKWYCHGEPELMITRPGKTYFFGSRIETPEVEVCDE